MSKKELFKDQFINSKYSSLSGKYLYNWTEDSVGISSDDIYDNTSAQKNFIGISITNRRLKWLMIFCIIIFFLILFKTAYLQLLKGSEYKILAENNRVRIKDIISERGIIYDANKKPLTENIPNFSLTIIPQDLPSTATLEGKLARKKIIKKIVAISKINEEKINNILKEFLSYSYASLVIEEDLDYTTALKIYLESSNLPGIYIEKSSKRKYLNNEINNQTNIYSLSHILGYIGKLSKEEYKNLREKNYLLFDSIGKMGLEKVYETQLRGEYGQQKVEVDVNGQEKNILTEKAPRP